MSVTAARGFVAAGIPAGIKPSGNPDLSLVATEDGVAVTAAGVFTQNKATAAPVTVTKAHLAATEYVNREPAEAQKTVNASIHFPKKW